MVGAKASQEECLGSVAWLGKGRGGRELVLVIPQNGRKQGSKNISHHQREREENKVKVGKECKKSREKKTQEKYNTLLLHHFGWVKHKPRKRAA